MNDIYSRPIKEVVEQDCIVANIKPIVDNNNAVVKIIVEYIPNSPEAEQLPETSTSTDNLPWRKKGY